MNHKSGTIQTDITGTNKPISLAQFDPIYPNCVVDTLTYKKSVENNQRIFEFLDKKYESKWRNDLKVKPFGIK